MTLPWNFAMHDINSLFSLFFQLLPFLFTLLVFPELLARKRLYLYETNYYKRPQNPVLFATGMK